MRIRETAPMSNPNMKEELRALIAEIAEKDEIPDDVSFKDLGIDSMMGVEIVAAIERKYHVKIDDEELQEVTTLNNSMSLVQKKLGAERVAGAA
jgi:acyl carrier protein